MSSGTICPHLSGVDLEGNSVLVECIEHKCKMWVMVSGTHPETNAPINEFDCTYIWDRVMQGDTNRKLMNLVGTVGSMRNETVKLNKAAVHLQHQTLSVIARSSEDPKLINSSEESYDESDR